MNPPRGIRPCFGIRLGQTNLLYFIHFAGVRKINLNRTIRLTSRRFLYVVIEPPDWLWMVSTYLRIRQVRGRRRALPLLSDNFPQISPIVVGSRPRFLHRRLLVSNLPTVTELCNPANWWPCYSRITELGCRLYRVCGSFLGIFMIICVNKNCYFNFRLNQRISTPTPQILTIGLQFFPMYNSIQYFRRLSY